MKIIFSLKNNIAQISHFLSHSSIRDSECPLKEGRSVHEQLHSSSKWHSHLCLSVNSLCSESLGWTSSLLSGSDLILVSDFSLDQPSGYDAGCLSKGQVASDNISGEKADVGELLRGCEA